MSDPKEMNVLKAIHQKADQLPGHVGFYYKNLSTGFEYGLRENDVYAAASVIKLPLMMHILKECSAGRMSLTEKLTVTADDKVPVCGALTLFLNDIEVDIHTLCRLMISLSDNTATNKLITRATLDGISEGFLAMGLKQTKLNRLLFDAAASEAGIQNVICLREIGALLEQLHYREFVSPAVSQAALDMLFLQQVDHKLNGKLCSAVPIAHKTGEDDQLSSDVGIVYAAQPFVICFAGYETDVYAWEDLMRQGTYDLCKALENDF